MKKGVTEQTKRDAGGQRCPLLAFECLWLAALAGAATHLAHKRAMKMTDKVDARQPAIRVRFVRLDEVRYCDTRTGFVQ